MNQIKVRAGHKYRKTKKSDKADDKIKTAFRKSKTDVLQLFTSGIKNLVSKTISRFLRLFVSNLGSFSNFLEVSSMSLMLSNTTLRFSNK